MKNSRLTSRMIIICFLFISFPSKSQIFDNVDGISVNPKLGFYNYGEGGFAGGGDVNIMQNNYVFSGAFYMGEEFTIFGPTPTEEFNSIDFLAGKYYGERFFRFTMQAGLGAIWGQKRGNFIGESAEILFSTEYYEKETFFTPAIPLKLAFKFIPFQFLAIGIDVQANLNLEYTYLMPAISLEIGKLRGELQ